MMRHRTEFIAPLVGWGGTIIESELRTDWARLRRFGANIDVAAFSQFSPAAQRLIAYEFVEAMARSGEIGVFPRAMSDLSTRFVEARSEAICSGLLGGLGDMPSDWVKDQLLEMLMNEGWRVVRSGLKRNERIGPYQLRFVIEVRSLGRCRFYCTVSKDGEPYADELSFLRVLGLMPSSEKIVAKESDAVGLSQEVTDFSNESGRVFQTLADVEQKEEG